MTSSTNTAKLQEVDAKTLKNLIDRQEVCLIDVREPSEYASDRIPGAKLLPLATLNPSLVTFDPNKILVLYCQSGRRSTLAAQKLFDGGFSQVTHLKGGLPSWKNAGYTTEKDQNAPISLFRQVQIVAGSLVVLGTLLGAFVSPWFLILSGFVGSGLVFAGITNTCALAMLLAKLPYNQPHRGK
jgi:rhodanese-related sulfurtransferase